MQHAGLAVKVTRRRKKNQPDGEATYKAEILGTVVKVCRFRGKYKRECETCAIGTLQQHSPLGNTSIV